MNDDHGAWQGHIHPSDCNAECLGQNGSSLLFVHLAGRVLALHKQQLRRVACSLWLRHNGCVDCERWPRPPADSHQLAFGLLVCSFTPQHKELYKGAIGQCRTTRMPILEEDISGNHMLHSLVAVLAGL